MRVPNQSTRTFTPKQFIYTEAETENQERCATIDNHLTMHEKKLFEGVAWLNGRKAIASIQCLGIRSIVRSALMNRVLGE